jgi:hypothetical protein
VAHPDMPEETGAPDAPISPPGSTPEPPAGRGVAVLLAGTAIVAAIIGGRVAFRSFTATNLWQHSVRQETKQAAAYVETIRYVYTSEAPAAFALSEAKFRAEELAKVAPTLGGLDRSVVELEEALQESLATGPVADSSPLFSDERYRSDVGFDISRRLADARNEDAGLLALNPEKTRAAGRRASVHAVRLLATTIVVALAFLCGSLAQGFPRRRQAFLTLGSVVFALGIVSAAVVEVVS